MCWCSKSRTTENSPQHAAHLAMLQEVHELSGVVVLTQSLSQLIVSELMGQQTSVHCMKKYNSGGQRDILNDPNYHSKQRIYSSLNHVELQNGCLTHGHSNTYIPSTLAGSFMDPTTGETQAELQVSH